MKRKTITIVSLDDWEVLYDTDGNMVTGGHSLQIQDLFKALQKEELHPKDLDYETIYNEKLNAYGEEYGDLPDTLAEVQDIINK